MARIKGAGGVTLQKKMNYIDRRKMEAADYLRGMTQAELSEKYEIDQSTVSRDLEAIRQEWLQSTLVDFNEIKVQELAKIDNLERIYWEAWERSVGVHTRTTETYSDKDGTKYSTLTYPLVGDSKFLQGIQWCIEQRCKLFGLYEAAKIDITWKEEAERAGIDTGTLFEQLVNEYVAALTPGNSEDAG